MITIHACGPRNIWGMIPEWREVECSTEELAILWEDHLAKDYVNVERIER